MRAANNFDPAGMLLTGYFRQVNDNVTVKHWSTLCIHVEGAKVNFRLSNSKPVETSNLMNYETGTLKQIKKRLDLLYPAVINLIS